MTDPATPYRTPHPIPFGEAMSGVLATVQLVPPGPEPDETARAETGRPPATTRPPSREEGG
ncbi:MAG: hypothetical protein J2P40_12185 [Candidatus Dormibacteraeota bacterium]|nr:hypothetical protein [Candidatus Dormibacteraeota bacterium]MBO0762025.1 hypothetical protein [Candidatus Dormibacteraeota bacterium]